VPDTALAVAVLVGEHQETGADLTQLYEREGDHRARDAVLLRGDEAVGRVLDLPWQEADAGHWERAAAEHGRVVLAGRLAADNVREAIERVRPWAVDASSRLETAPGVKDHDAVRAFVEAAR
jgi:phosphoribosylanthranilate isomerase